MPQEPLLPFSPYSLAGEKLDSIDGLEKGFFTASFTVFYTSNVVEINNLSYDFMLSVQGITHPKQLVIVDNKQTNNTELV